METKESKNCQHKLKCENCGKSFTSLNGERSHTKCDDSSVQITRKTNNTHINIYIQPERKGLLKWLIGLFW